MKHDLNESIKTIDKFYIETQGIDENINKLDE